MQPSTFAGSASPGAGARRRAPRRDAGRAVGAPRWLAPVKIAVFVASLYPLARIVFFGMTDRLGANPIEFITRSTGLWTDRKSVV